MQKMSAVSSTQKELKTISVFVTNLAKYNNGELIGEWLDLPTTPKKIKQCFKRIGINNSKHEEFIFTDYKSSIEGISKYISEYSNLNELNYLAYKLEELDDDDIKIYEAAIDLNGYVQSLADLINLTGNLDCFHCLYGLKDEYDLGYYWIVESGCYNLELLGKLADYFDYEAFGYDIALEQGGIFYAGHYIYCMEESFYENYDGKNVPEEYCLL